MPVLPLPEPLRGNETGSFAHTTVAVRLPAIARRVLAENDLPPAIESRINDLIAEIPYAPVRLIDDPGAADLLEWNSYLAPYQGVSWLDVPWFLAETYFYRRIVEAIGYFQPGPWYARDPYAYQKLQGLNSSRAAILALAAQVHAWHASSDPGRTLAIALAVALWGNQADLSLWPAGTPGVEADHSAERLLVDDTAAAVDLLSGNQSRSVALVVDNAGLELVGDLCLVDALLLHGVHVDVHLKFHPTFVSDAIPADLYQTIAWLEQAGPDCRALAGRLTTALSNGRMALHNHHFWNSPLAGWELPTDLSQALSGANVIISKGDANYRRWLGDRHWPLTTPFSQILAYAPAPLLALRTLKSELAVGLHAGQANQLAQHDPQWMTNGRWGVIQLAVNGLKSSVAK